MDLLWKRFVTPGFGLVLENIFSALIVMSWVHQLEGSCVLTCRLICTFPVVALQEPEGPSVLGSGQNAAMQQNSPAAPLEPRRAPSQIDAVQEPPSSQGCGPTPTPRHSLPQAPPTRPDCHSLTAPTAAPPPPGPAPQHLPLVDVRMIDFAHSTFKGFRGDTAVHDGPDRGYVFGLESLVQILESLRDDNLP